MSTEAPASRAARAAQNAALPPPTTMTSHSFIRSSAEAGGSPVRFRPAARIAHEGLDFVQLGSVEFLALLRDRQHVPPGGERMMRDAQIGQDFQPFRKDGVIEEDERMIA